MVAKQPKVVIVDHGAGNVSSVVNALQKLGASVELSSDGQIIQEAQGVIVPGVGEFDSVMKGINKIHAHRWIGRRIAGGRPVLGICAGHQVLFETSTENNSVEPGMGEWPGKVEKLPAETLPHMGWSKVRPPQDTVLFKGVEDERFYFIHSYAVLKWQFEQGNQSMTPPGVTWANYGSDFIAAVENGPLFGTQFHPEKSGPAGLQLLDNWLGVL